VNAALAVLKRKRVGHVWDMNQRLSRADGGAGRASNERPFYPRFSDKDRPPRLQKNNLKRRVVV